MRNQTAAKVCVAAAIKAFIQGFLHQVDDIVFFQKINKIALLDYEGRKA